VEQSDYAAAENQLTRALQHYIRAENGFGIASANYWLGRTALEKGQDDQTIALCTESLHIFESEGDRLGVAQNLNLLALCHIRKYGDYQAALADLEKSVLLQRGLPPTASYVETLRHLARVKSVVEEFEVAASYLLEATQVAQQQQDIGEYAAVLYERLLLCKKRKQFAEALTLGYESLENFRLLGSLRWEALLKTQLGLLHQAQQNPLQALGLLNAGLQLFMELGDIYEQAYSQYYLYRLYAEIDQPAQSLLAKEQAARLNLKLEDTYLAQLLA
jgi:tetratricopeptide (TPR) repeat protein